MWTVTHRNILKYAETYTHARINTNTCMSKHAHIIIQGHTHKYTNTHKIYMYMCIHVRTHITTYTRAPACSRMHAQSNINRIFVLRTYTLEYYFVKPTHYIRH